MNFSEGESSGEFHHLLSDIINGLVAEGLMIRGVWENPRPDHGSMLAELEPGSDNFRARYMPLSLREMTPDQPDAGDGLGCTPSHA